MNRNSLSFLSLLAILFSIAPFGAYAQNTIVLEAEADTHVRNDLAVRANDNYGCHQNLIVGTDRSGGADAMRSLIRFNLSGIRAKHLKSAKLIMTLYGFDNGSPSSLYTVDVHRIVDSGSLTPWLEGNGMEGVPIDPACTGTDPAFGVAWDGIDANNQTQPVFDTTVVTSVTIDQGSDLPGTVFEFDITSLVNDWLDGTVPNHGIVLRDQTTDGTFRGVVFGSREGKLLHIPDPAVQNGPRLVLDIVGGAKPSKSKQHP